MAWYWILFLTLLILILLCTVLYKPFFKRFLDIVCSLLALILFSWLYVILIILVRIKLGSPVLFKQNRPGKIDKSTGKERIFKLYKFRTMTDEKDKAGKLLPDSERLTPFGHLLRTTSLDELPEAINILKGDMSIIGPRPLAVEYIPYYNDEERKRHSVRPGLSGWAQVNGRTAINWDQRFSYDIEYVNNMSFLFDLKILFKTVANVLARKDVIEAEFQEDFDSWRRNQLREKIVERSE